MSIKLEMQVSVEDIEKALNEVKMISLQQIIKFRKINLQLMTTFKNKFAIT